MSMTSNEFLIKPNEHSFDRNITLRRSTAALAVVAAGLVGGAVGANIDHPSLPKQGRSEISTTTIDGKIARDLEDKLNFGSGTVHITAVEISGDPVAQAYYDRTANATSSPLLRLDTSSYAYVSLDRLGEAKVHTLRLADCDTSQDNACNTSADVRPVPGTLRIVSDKTGYQVAFSPDQPGLQNEQFNQGSASNTNDTPFSGTLH